MRFITTFFQIVIILIGLFKANCIKAQCTVNINPQTIFFVNGTLDTTISSNIYYVGNGDSLTITSGLSDVYVDNGGYVKFDVPGIGTYAYAAAGATLVLYPNTFFVHLYRDIQANIVNVGNVSVDNVCAPLNFVFTGGGQNSSVDSFKVIMSQSCSGPTLTTVLDAYIPGASILTSFGDGSFDTSNVLSYANIGYSKVQHDYNLSGVYSIKQIMYLGTNAVDSFIIPFVHSFCTSMSVQFYNDANNNCVYDVGTDYSTFSPLSVEVDSVNIPVDTITCTSGFTYTAFGGAGDVYKFKILTLPGDMVATCPITGIISDTLHPGVNSTKYMGIGCINSTVFDYGVFSAIPVTGANDQWGHIYLTNPYCYGPNATLTLKHSPKYKYTSGANPAPASYTNNTLTWNLNNINANNQAPTKIYFVLWQANGPLMANDTVQNRITISPTTSDLNPQNNSIIVVDTVDASCDPNAIYVKPEGCVAPGTNLEYTITFENIGNVPAENIYVLDTLPAGLDQSSMKLKFASHNMYVEKIYNGQQTTVKFSFPNIMLPDSSDHENCHGTFIYTINSRNNYPIGSAIHHRAGIYFDYNLPVMTNTASTVMCWPTNVNTTASRQQGILIYPNPATEDLIIKTDKQYTSYTISNSIGQVMMKNNLTAKESKFNIRSLAPGIYYISLKGEGSSEVRKFVKM